MAVKSYQLIVRAGPNPGKIYPIMKSELAIGRDPKSDILINDAEISRHHAVIKATQDGYTIEDLGSTNGTIINGQRVTGPHLLQPGEMINLGEHIALVFETQQAFDPDATIASAAISFASPEPRKPVLPPSNSPIPAYQAPITHPVLESDVYQENVPAQETRNMPKWLIYVLIGVILVTVICIAGVLWYIDSNYLWCRILPFLPGCLNEPSTLLQYLRMIG